MKIPHDKFCVLPWISLETSPVGTVRPCCLAEEEITDDQGLKFQLVQADLRQVQNSGYMKNLRQQFLNQQQPQTCRKCWNEERAGRTSKRMHTLDRLKHVLEDESWDETSKPLKFLDLKLGNICNLKCRICGSWSSSTFASEELRFISGDQEKKSSYHYTMLKQGTWPKNNSVFWDQMKPIMTGIRYIEFTGGEPFMIQEHFRLLQDIVDLGLAHQVEIHYNTNGTQWPHNAISIWQHFRTVEIAFSIDDVGERFEYQRSNADWVLVQENIEKFRALRQAHSNIHLQVCSTVNVFNVFYLGELASWIHEQQFDFVYWNMLHEAWYFSVATLCQSAKEHAAKRLDSAEVAQQTRQEFDRIKDFMFNGTSLDGSIMMMKIRDLDWRRQQDLRDHHSELATAIGYQGPNA